MNRQAGAATGADAVTVVAAVHLMALGGVAGDASAG
jgi:hypothetical protein